MRRMLVAAAVAGMSFASFAGCSQDAGAPVPVSSATTPASAPTTAEGCSPGTALVAWERVEPGNRVMVSAYTLTNSGDGRWAAGYTDVESRPKWTDANLSTIARTTAERSAWRGELLASARSTGQVDSEFGEAVALRPDSIPPLVPEKSSRHQFVGTVVQRSVAMPFAIHCGGDIGDITGSVSAVVLEGKLVSLYDCTLPASTDAAQAAHEYCPAQ